MLAIRDEFGKELIEIGRDYPDVVVGTAELMHPTRCDGFAHTYPERFFEVGIAEQSLFGTAAGLASAGKVPIAVSYANFSCLRAGEQLRNDIAYTNFNVKVVALSCGVSFGEGGISHQSYEDIAVMRAISNFVVLSPADGAAIRKAVRAAVEYKGPVYIRGGRGEEYVVYDDECPFEIGKANVLREGSDVAVIATGCMVREALRAAETLEADGLSVRVVDVHTIKPIDQAEVERAAQTKLIVTAEEHRIIGGLGGAVLEALAEKPHPPVYRIGFADNYPPVGPKFELREHLGLSAAGIVRTVRRALDIREA